MDVKENLELMKECGVKAWRLPNNEEYAAMEQDPSTKDLNFFTVDSYSVADDILVVRETKEPTFLMQSNYKLPDDVGSIKMPKQPEHFFKVTDKTSCKEVSKNTSVFVSTDRACSTDGFYLVFQDGQNFPYYLKHYPEGSVALYINRADAQSQYSFSSIAELKHNLIVIGKILHFHTTFI